MSRGHIDSRDAVTHSMSLYGEKEIAKDAVATSLAGRIWSCGGSKCGTAECAWRNIHGRVRKERQVLDTLRIGKLGTF